MGQRCGPRWRTSRGRRVAACGGRAITEDTNAGSLDDRIGSALWTLDGAYAGAACLLLDGAGTLRCATSTGTDAQRLAVGEELCGEGPGHDAFSTSTVVSSDDVHLDVRWPRLAALSVRSPARKLLAVPVLATGAPVGCIVVHACTAGAWVRPVREAVEGAAVAVGELLSPVVGGHDHAAVGEPLALQLRAGAAARELIMHAAELVAADGDGTVARAAVHLRHVAAAARVAPASLAEDAVDRGHLPDPLDLRERGEQRRRSDASWARLALEDPLTGLANRVKFLDRLEHALARAARTGCQPAVVFADLDRFKVANDSLGHDAGDQVLRAVAARLRAAVRPQDTVARLGGDEFAVLCDDTGPSDAARFAVGVAERMLRAVGDGVAVTLPGEDGSSRHVPIGVSVGVALLEPGDGPPRDAREVLADADRAMYAAKEAGGHRVHVFNDRLREAGRRRTRLELALRETLDRDDGGGSLALAYQPIVELASGRVVALEALARWSHQQLGVVPAAELVAVAEDARLMGALGARLLRQACGDARTWEGRPGPHPTVAVNVSAQQLAGDGFVEQVLAAVTASGLPVERICLELTETQVIDAAAGALVTLERLVAEGVNLTLDDFGTGYSSLAYLTRLPIRRLKIARELLAGLDAAAAGVGHRAGAEVARAVVALARNLSITVVAEGIETQAQARAVAGLGCDLAQGFWFAPPVPAAAVDGLLEDRGVAAW